MASCRSIRKNTVSITKAIEENMASAMTTSPTAKEMPSAVRPARTGRRTIWRIAMVVVCENSAARSKAPLNSRR